MDCDGSAGQMKKDEKVKKKEKGKKEGERKGGNFIFFLSVFFWRVLLLRCLFRAAAAPLGWREREIGKEKGN